MARINSYTPESNPSLDDRLLGSDYNSDNKATRQYPLANILTLFEGVNSGPIIGSMYAADVGEADETNEGFFSSTPTDAVIGTTTEIKINKTSSMGQDLSAYFQLFIDFLALPDTILRFTIKNSGNNTNFGYFNVSTIADSTTHFTITLSNISPIASGSFIDENTYLFIPEFRDSITSGGVNSVTGNLVDNTDPASPIVSGVEGITGNLVDNTDPSNPVITGLAYQNTTWAALVANGSRVTGELYNITDAHPITAIVYGRVTLTSDDHFEYTDKTTAIESQITIV